MENRLHRSRFTSWLWMVAVPTMMLMTALPQTTFGEDVKETDQILNQAATTWQNFMQDPDMSAFRDNVKQAKGVLILPRMVKGAFLFGLEGGLRKADRRSRGATYALGAKRIGTAVPLRGRDGEEALIV